MDPTYLIATAVIYLYYKQGARSASVRAKMDKLKDTLKSTDDLKQESYDRRPRR